MPVTRLTALILVATLLAGSATPSIRTEYAAVAAALEALVGAHRAVQRPMNLHAQFGAPLTRSDMQVPEYVINLDVDPAHRYDEFAPAFTELFAPVMSSMLSLLPQGALPSTFAAMEHLHGSLPSPYKEEISGIAKATGLPVSFVTLTNVFYELVVGCTSVVAEHTSVGGNVRISHGRNLDYMVSGLHSIQIQAKYTRQGRVIYTGTTFLGYVGLLTGLRPSAFSVSLNQRMGGGFSEAVFHRMLNSGNGAQLVGFFLRDLLEAQSTFSSALAVVETAPLVSGAYFTVGGVRAGEGAVVTRSPDRAVHTRTLDGNMGRWYLVQMNHDSWEPSPQGDHRLSTAQAALEASSPETFSVDYMYDAVLSTPPVLNFLTIYTTVMSAGTNLYHTTCRNDCQDVMELLPLPAGNVGSPS